jgi:hypothetical protein
MVTNLKQVYKKSTLDSLKQSVTGIVDTLANTLIVRIEFKILALFKKNFKKFHPRV